MSESTEYRLRQLLNDIWRQHPPVASTFSPCINAARGCQKAARGGGECDDCLSAKLTRMLGGNASPAQEYVDLVRSVRVLEREMLEILEEGPV